MINNKPISYMDALSICYNNLITPPSDDNQYEPTWGELSPLICKKVREYCEENDEPIPGVMSTIVCKCAEILLAESESK